MKKTIVTIIIALFLPAVVISFVSGNFPLLMCQVPLGIASSLNTRLNIAPINTDGATLYTFRVVNVYPHDPEAFTQGLIFHKGHIYEGTGLHGLTSLRKVQLKTGKVLKSYQLPAEYFGEGITIWQNRLIQLTWRSHTGFIYDLQSFRPLGKFSYPTEGWGITCDGNHLIMSDGTATLRFLDPRTFKKAKQIKVMDRSKVITHINELEYVKGEIYANIWDTGYIARISPQTGQVLGWIDLRGLYSHVAEGKKVDVLNGIAYDAKNDRLFVTGKFWPKLFEIKLVR